MFYVKILTVAIVMFLLVFVSFCWFFIFGICCWFLLDFVGFCRNLWVFVGFCWILLLHFVARSTVVLFLLLYTPQTRSTVHCRIFVPGTVPAWYVVYTTKTKQS